MNSQKYKIQALIAEIDEVLSKPAPRLPWTGSLDTVHQRQLLERVRAYLFSQDSKLAIPNRPPAPNVRPVPVPVPKLPMPPAIPSAAEQIMLAVTGEISNLRSSLTGPLQQDIEALRQEQQALIQEIKQLEAQRQQQQSLAQQQANQQQIISEFLQVLRSRLTETLDRDLSQIFATLENQFLPSSAAQSEQSALNPQTSEELPLLTPGQRLEQMQNFQARADSLLMRLDSTMNMAFDGLETNLQSYQASLGQGLENMYGLSQQSEAMFAAFVNHLATQLGREASSYVQQPISVENLETAAPSATDSSGAAPAISNRAIEPDAPATRENLSGELPEQDRFPYAGTEISQQFGQVRHDRDPIETPLSLSDWEDNLFGSAPEEESASVTLLSGAESEDMLAENGEDVEDLYASLFAEKEVAELKLELEEFTIENTESAATNKAVISQNAGEETAELLNDAEDLFVNLLDEGESLEDYLGETSDFVIGDSIEDLTLDSEDLFELQVATVPQVSEPPAKSSIAPQLDSDDRPNRATAKNLGDSSDTATLPQPPTLSATPETSPKQPSAARLPSARDVRTGESDASSQLLDDDYIQASPDEDLLPVEALEDDLDRALNLDNNTLELLETDLYNLEGLEGLENTAERRSNSSAVNSFNLANSSDDGAENPFPETLEEEFGTLEDLFSDVLELSSEDESFVLEDELEDDLFVEEDESKLTLDDILASLTQTDRETAETDELRSTPAESKKKT
ncbi:hypothetical protein IQ269_14855 [Tychonema sp. LEGE 07199]|uniref:hypothetical protein n=1 Tax=unclassified Tychonema TaxID=2642144 RepID=UPI001880C9DA|nr:MULTISPECIES: hypothetical protein [unclassified Tychonema]MBE9122051.1 hypothetical protein [Tychonema sp. LEGE 07199]MBE9134265.1 hypothetical protein [Tychonema sp. LEGE 07196]